MKKGLVENLGNRYAVVKEFKNAEKKCNREIKSLRKHKKCYKACPRAKSPTGNLRITRRFVTKYPRIMNTLAAIDQ